MVDLELDLNKKNPQISAIHGTKDSLMLAQTNQAIDQKAMREAYETLKLYATTKGNGNGSPPVMSKDSSGRTIKFFEDSKVPGVGFIREAIRALNKESEKDIYAVTVNEGSNTYIYVFSAKSGFLGQATTTGLYGQRKSTYIDKSSENYKASFVSCQKALATLPKFK